MTFYTSKLTLFSLFRCVPPEAMDALLGGGQGNPEAWPEGVYSGCEATDGPIEEIRSRAGKWLALEIIGGINFMSPVVAIDEHDIWVYAMDGAYIEPQKVQAIAVTNGDRYSVLVHTEQPGHFKIRGHSSSPPQIITGHANLFVKGPGSGCHKESKPWIGLVGEALGEDVVFFNQDTAAPYPPEPIPQSADALHVLNMLPDGASYLWALNSTRLMPDDLEKRTPPFLFAPTPNIQNNVTITTKNNTWVDLVLYASVFPMPSHPIHKHGNKMYQIGKGTGEWIWDSVDEAIKEIPESFNLKNPPRRDAFMSPLTEASVAWVVVRYHVSNPGPWLLHCHVNNHQLGGMVVVIQDGVGAWPEVPEKYVNF